MHQALNSYCNENKHCFTCIRHLTVIGRSTNKHSFMCTRHLTAIGRSKNKHNCMCIRHLPVIVQQITIVGSMDPLCSR